MNSHSNLNSASSLASCSFSAYSASFDSDEQCLPTPGSAPPLDIALLASPLDPALLSLSCLPRDTRLEGQTGKLPRLTHESQLEFLFALIRPLFDRSPLMLSCPPMASQNCMSKCKGGREKRVWTGLPCVVLDAALFSFYWRIVGIVRSSFSGLHACPVCRRPRTFFLICTLCCLLS